MVAGVLLACFTGMRGLPAAICTSVAVMGAAMMVGIPTVHKEARYAGYVLIFWFPGTFSSSTRVLPNTVANSRDLRSRRDVACRLDPEHGRWSHQAHYVLLFLPSRLRRRQRCVRPFISPSCFPYLTPLSSSQRCSNLSREGRTRLPTRQDCRSRFPCRSLLLLPRHHRHSRSMEQATRCSGGHHTDRSCRE